MVLQTSIIQKTGCIALVLSILFLSCGSGQKPPEKVIVQERSELVQKTPETLQSILKDALNNEGLMRDSLQLREPGALNSWYREKEFQGSWSKGSEWLPIADSLYEILRLSEYRGLLPQEYHQLEIYTLRQRLREDSATRLDAALWAKGDILLTDALLHMIRHLHWGRLTADSITLRDKKEVTDQDLIRLAEAAIRTSGLTTYLNSLEPRHEGYWKLRFALPSLVDSMDRRRFTYLEYPVKDSVQFPGLLQQRLYESGFLDFNDRKADTTELKNAIRKYQVARKLTVDGKAGREVINALNNTDFEKFIRVAINLDRYKMLTDTMPVRYVWVNIPGFYMQMWDTDTIVFESKVIVGQPKTRTPLLTSEISQFITLPQWTVPYSIIFKEMLPKIQKNPNYLLKENLMVVDKNDSIIDPFTIDWSKMSKTYFPYLLKQRQGDDNSLGVIKFNFRNKYSVYMHDTNARGLFSRKNRAMSHGCVRVQEWEKFAHYLVRNDSLNFHRDTVNAWISRKEKHVVNLGERVPVYFRYFSVEGSNGKLLFFEDIYLEDKAVRPKFIVKS